MDFLQSLDHLKYSWLHKYEWFKVLRKLHGKKKTNIR